MNLSTRFMEGTLPFTNPTYGVITSSKRLHEFIPYCGMSPNGMSWRYLIGDWKMEAGRRTMN